MLRLLVDENIDSRIIKGLVARVPDADIVDARDVGLRRAADPEVLAWAAREQRVVITHDRSTMIGYAYERVEASLPMPGVFVIGDDLAIGRAIADLLLVVQTSFDGEWEGQVRYLPL